MINVILSGCNGHMGQVIESVIQRDDQVKTVCGFDINTVQKNDFPVVSEPAEFEGRADVIIDFSHPACFEGLMQFALGRKVPIVVATTGLSKQQLEQLQEAAKEIPVFFSANMSLGVNLLIDLVKKATRVLEGNFDIEIVEKHHNQKIDAPSGTALAIADAVADTLSAPPEYVFDRHSVRKKREPKEIGIHSIRGGSIVGEHSVIFAGQDEVVEIKHQATSKEVFAVGAVRAAKFLVGCKPGMYHMTDLVNSL